VTVASLGRRVLVAAGTWILLCGSVPASVSAQPREAASPRATPIPVPEIAGRAEDVAALLPQITDRLLPGPETQEIETRLPATHEWIRGRLVGTAQALASSTSPSTLATLAETWSVVRSGLAAWDDTLARQATRLEAGLQQLEPLRATWSASRAEAVASSAPASVLERIDATLAAIAAARQRLEEARARVLGLQDGVAQEIARCDDVLGRIGQARSARRASLFTPDSRPIWGPEARLGISTALGPRLREPISDAIELTRQFFAQHLARVPFQVALFVTVFALVRQARARARRRTELTPSEQTAARVVELPVSSALVLALVATVWLYPQVPRTVMNGVGLLILLPAVRVVKRLATGSLAPAVYALAAFFLVDRIRDVCSVIPVLEQWVFLVEMVFGIGFLALAVRSERLRNGTRVAGKGWLGLRGVLWGALALLVCALLVGALGFMELARLVGGGVLESSYVALVLYAAVRVAEGLVVYVLRVRPLRQLYMVQRYRELLARRLQLGLSWVAVAVWVSVTLDRLGLMSPVWTAGTVAWNARYVRGSISLSLGDVVAFGLTIWSAFLLSSLVRFALEEDVYPRAGLSRGVPYVLSTLVHYAVLLVGFLFASAALGLDLTRVTILAGAFGLGVGIGLQSVVANFVAGLVLLFERRINVGDSVQIGDLQGEVREIGTRASTIRTGNGAEVIIPNGRLTSEQVVNWTLSDRMRRVDLPVGVGYTSDPGRVLAILSQVGTVHANVLAEPAPTAPGWTTARCASSCGSGLLAARSPSCSEASWPWPLTPPSRRPT
jgi:potassium-dependent mechanosensitive channel